MRIVDEHGYPIDDDCDEEPPKQTNYERILNMSVEEMTEFIRSMVDDGETHDIACYGCINYGTHHSDINNKGTNLYECDGCYCEGMGHDIEQWLLSEVDDND